MSYWLDVLKSEKPQRAKGKVLDHFGELYGVDRKRYLYLFKEFDYFYRKRLVEQVRNGHKKGRIFND